MLLDVVWTQSSLLLRQDKEQQGENHPARRRHGVVLSGPPALGIGDDGPRCGVRIASTESVLAPNEKAETTREPPPHVAEQLRLCPRNASPAVAREPHGLHVAPSLGARLVHEVRPIRKDELLTSLDVPPGKTLKLSLASGGGAVWQARMVEPRAEDVEPGGLGLSAFAEAVVEELLLHTTKAVRANPADGEECRLRIPRHVAEGVHDVVIHDVRVPLVDDDERLLSEDQGVLLNRSCGESAPFFARRWLQLEGRVGGDREAAVRCEENGQPRSSGGNLRLTMVRVHGGGWDGMRAGTLCETGSGTGRERDRVER